MTQHWENCPAPICNDERGYVGIKVLQRGNIEKEKLNRAMTTVDIMEL